MKALSFLLCLSFLTLSFAQDSEQEQRDKILSQYGKKEEQTDQTDQTNQNENINPQQGNTIVVDTRPEIAQNSNTNDWENEDAQDVGNLGGNNLDLSAMTKKADIDPKELDEILKKLEKNPMLKMLSKDKLKNVASMMKKNPFGEMKKSAIKSMILNKLDPNKPAGKFLHENPKVADFAADWVVDDKAIPSFMSILNQPDKMKMFGGIVLGVFIAAFLLNLKNTEGGMLKKIMFKIALMMSTTVINFGSFYFVFKKELQPTLDIFFRHFF